MSVRLTQWSAKMKTGHKEIDKQHMALFQMLDEFMAAILKNRGDKKVEKLFYFLGKYTKEHFYFEEEYYRRKNYPQLAEHIKDHEEFVQSLRLLRKDSFKVCSEQNMRQLNEMLGEWLRVIS
jgi:hemerythrin-like metal-binding protein